MEERLEVLIVDDEPLCIAQLKQQLAAFSTVHVAGELNSGKGYAEFLKTHAVDLVFLDIRIQEENGFSIAEFTKKNFQEKMIVFTTGFEDFAIQGYEYEPLDFLAKPIQLPRLKKTLDHAMERKKHQVPTVTAKIGIHMNGGLRFVPVNEILFIERVGRKNYLVCQKEGRTEEYLVRESMTELEKIFAGYDFLRVHQSFLVSLTKIRSLSGTEIGNSYELEVDGYERKIPVSRAKHREVENRLQEREFPVL